MQNIRILLIALAHILWLWENIFVYQKKPKTKGFRIATYLSLIVLLWIKLLWIWYFTRTNVYSTGLISNYDSIQDVLRATASMFVAIGWIYGVWWSFVSKQTQGKNSKKLLYLIICTNIAAILNILIFTKYWKQFNLEPFLWIRTLFVQALFWIILYKAYNLKKASPWQKALACFMTLVIGKFVISYFATYDSLADTIANTRTFFIGDVRDSNTSLAVLFVYQEDYLNIAFVIRWFAAWTSYALFYSKTKNETIRISTILSTMFITNALVHILI